MARGGASATSKQRSSAVGTGLRRCIHTTMRALSPPSHQCYRRRSGAPHCAKALRASINAQDLVSMRTLDPRNRALLQATLRLRPLFFQQLKPQRATAQALSLTSSATSISFL